MRGTRPGPGEEIGRAHEYTTISNAYYVALGKTPEEFGEYELILTQLGWRSYLDQQFNIGVQYWGAYVAWVANGEGGEKVEVALKGVNVSDIVKDIHNNEKGMLLAARLSPDLYEDWEVANEVIKHLNAGWLYVLRDPWCLPNAASPLVPSDDEASVDNAWEQSLKAASGTGLDTKEELDFNVPTPLETNYSLSGGIYSSSAGAVLYGNSTDPPDLISFYQVW